MRTTTIEKLAVLQRKPRNIRNICILAHVDHGKTTLADSLVASNGIISQRMAGKLRYMDSREDEQLRGITMKSSAISLVYTKDEENYLVNLIDSPGHIDFSSEVSTAVRLCDGAVVMVDVVEGVCPQTHAVLRQAWLENIKPILVLNKIDRLITEWKMSPLEAHMHLLQTLEQVNAITAELFTSEIMEKSSAVVDEKKSDKEKIEQNGAEQIYDWSAGLEETDDSNLYFSPDQGNVVFASAIDGWSFRIGHFAELFSKKLGMSASALKKTLWGDFYLETKTKRIKRGAQAKAKKPLFVQFILENLWSVYESVMMRRDKDKMEKIVNSLNLKIPVRDMRHNDSRVQLQAICSQWLPLSKAVLEAVVDLLPSPLDIPEERAEKLLCSTSRRFDSLHPETQKLKQDFLVCSSGDDAPTILFVSKMFTCDRKALPQNRQRPLTQEEIAERREIARQRLAEKQAASAVNKHNDKNDRSKEEDKEIRAEKENGINISMTSQCEQNKPASDDPLDQVFIAFARVFSGTVKKGQKLYVLGPKHDPAKALQKVASGIDVTEVQSLKDLSAGEHVTSFTVEDLYLLMGREIDSLDEIPAGNVLGIGGLENHILKSATITNTVACPAFTDMCFEAAPIVRVAVEPRHAGDMKALVRGMKLLNQADPSVEVLVQQTGELVLIAAGEVHLQKCLDDLRNHYAKIEINPSKPIVPFRETIVPQPKTDMVNEAIEDRPKPKENTNDQDEDLLGDGLVQMSTPNNSCTIKLRAQPLPEPVTVLLEKNEDLINTLDQFTSAKIADKSDVQQATMTDETIKHLLEFKEKLKEAFANEGNGWTDVVDQIWSFGPRKVGPNILLNKVEGYDRPSVWACVETENLGNLRDFDHSIVNGFQMATLAGPLCEEPIRGVCYSVELWEMRETSAKSKPQGIENKDVNKPVSDKVSKELTCDTNIEKSLATDDVCDKSNIPIGADDLVSQFNDKCAVSSQLGINIDSMDVSGLSLDVTQSSVHSLSPPISPLSPPSTPHSPEVGPAFGYGMLTGQLMTLMMKACRKSFQSQPQRLVVAMYTCMLQAPTDVLGKMYAVLGKRNGRVVGEDMREGSSVFNIEAVLPVVESFGFAEEIRKRTSGLASPQLKFSHWEILDVDPFWVPTTEEEIMHFGEKADSENQALAYMNNVRRRKGLKVDEKIVEYAEKQRTLSKNK